MNNREMKKILLTILMLLPIAAYAESVSVGRAEIAARNFFGTTKTAPLELVWTGHGGATKAASGDVPFYVFNSPAGGFVVISGDDAIQPVLAYSGTGKFIVEGMPENISGWFAEIEKAVGHFRETGSVQEGAETKWRQFESGVVPRASVVKSYETALWGQREPFNLSLPSVDGEKCVAGCVATATAIIMRYYKYPEKGTGTLPGYTTSTEKIAIPSLQLGTKYQWDQMPLTNGKGGWTDTQKKAVSELMYHCGVMAEMDYGVDASAASEINVPTQLAKYFDYDAGGKCLYSYLYSTAEWTSLMKKELDSNGPVLYCGEDSSAGGHAFVLCGYDSNDYFAVNWGWYGGDNGYYSLPDLNPTSYKFTENHSALLGVKPDKGGKASAYLYSESYKDTDKGLTVSNTRLSKGEKFSISYSGAVINIGTATYEGKVAICQADKNCNFKERLTGEVVISELNPYYLVHFEETYENCTINGDIENGDVIKLFYKLSGSSEWVSMPYNREDEGCVYVVALEADEDPKTPIDESTSVSYDKAKGVMTVRSIAGIKVSLISSTGQEMSSSVKVGSDGTVTIDAAKLKGLTCTLTLYKGSKSKELKLKF